MTKGSSEAKSTMENDVAPDDAPFEAPDAGVLKRSNQGYVANLAKQYKELERLMLSIDNRETVRRKYAQLKGIYLLYEKKVKEYLNVLKPYHFAQASRSKAACEIEGCDQKHHTLLHYSTNRDPTKPAPNGAGDKDSKLEAPSGTILSTVTSNI